jgi:uncharacterized protein YndB with AHSA1/START domain
MDRSTTHNTFAIERIYDAAPSRVFHAWTDPVAKAQWFGNSSEAYRLDFRVGGTETNSGGPPGGPVYVYQGHFAEIVPDARVVSTYTMLMDGTLISVSVATVELTPAGSGTRLKYTEQGVYLDGHDDSAQREHGCRAILESLGEFLG